MGSYISSPPTITVNSPFDLTIETFTEYFAFTNYYLNLNGITYQTYNFVNNGDGTSSIIFPDLTVGSTGTFPFVLFGYDTNIAESTQILEGFLNVVPICFAKGTKILCLIDDKEQYVPIETLKAGTLVKTLGCGYKKLKVLAWCKFRNTSNTMCEPKCRMYKLPVGSVPDLFEPLFISSHHSILVDEMSEAEIKITLERKHNMKEIGGKKLVMAYNSDKCVPVFDDEEYEFFHVVLEGEKKSTQYGIWANGILTESLTMKTFIRKKSMLQDYFKVKNGI